MSPAGFFCLEFESCIKYKYFMSRKEDRYKWAASQVRSKVKHHVDTVSTLANTAAILKERCPNFFWVGFYFFLEDCLVLGPFQGPPACAKLGLDKGVCAAAASKKSTIIVPDVGQFPGHVACDSRSKSEIVVPVFDKNGALRALLDVDSENPGDFDQTDKQGLETIASLLSSIWT